jgi:hypothetical protein
MAERIDDADDLDAVEQRLVARLRAPVVVDASAFDARVMAAVQREPSFGRSSRDAARHATRTTGRATRRMVSAISVAGLAMAAAVAFIMIRGDGKRTVPVNHPVKVVRSAVSNVRFTLVASGASAVAVAGSFNGWSTAATPLRRIDKNTWTADIPLGAGRYVYQFVIDGHRWVPDPKAPRDAGDDFGATNSVVTVAGSGSA